MGTTDDLGDALRECAAAQFTGVLRVDGQPGGIVHLTGGRISACETSGAPGLEVILLRSQRVSVTDWDDVFTSAAVAERQMTAELVDRDLLGAGELEALLRTALADAVFAVDSGQVHGWTEAPAADCLLPLTPAVRSGWLLNEAKRRRQVLASFPEPAIGAQDRVAAVPRAAREGRVLGLGQDEILALADGRRTARDVAFALGRGLYETMLQLSRMRAGYMVAITPFGKESPSPDSSVANLVASLLTGSADATADDQTVTGLPRRRKDRQTPPRSAEASRGNRTASIRVLRPRSEGNEMPGGT